MQKALNDIPVPSKNDAPPMNIPITTNPNLGPIQHEVSIVIIFYSFFLDTHITQNFGGET